MRAALLNLPWSTDGRLGVRAGSRWPFTSVPEQDGRIHYVPFPFFLAYSASLIKKHGHEIFLVDAIAEGIGLQETMRRLMAFGPEAIVVETSTPSFENDMDLFSSMHEKMAGTETILCGPHAGVFAKDILSAYSFIDYVLVGEYEFTLLELLRQLKNKKEFSSVAGLAYRCPSGITLNPARHAIEDLNLLPWPERETLPMHNYNDAFAGLPVPNAQIWASRGCPFRCNFCLWPQTMYGEHRHRKRDPNDVVNEMEFLIKRFDFKAVYFDDDVFNADREYVLALCERIREKGIDAPWAAMARADLMDEAMLDVMAGAGLYAVKYGIESADENVQRFCNKRLDLKRCLAMIEATRQRGVKVHLTFCLGFPGETRESIEKTMRFIERALPDSCQYSFATPFPGTEFFTYAQDHGLLSRANWSEYDGGRRCCLDAHGFKDGRCDRSR